MVHVCRKRSMHIHRVTRYRKWIKNSAHVIVHVIVRDSSGWNWQKMKAWRDEKLSSYEYRWSQRLDIQCNVSKRCFPRCFIFNYFFSVYVKSHIACSLAITIWRWKYNRQQALTSVNTHCLEFKASKYYILRYTSQKFATFHCIYVQCLTEFFASAHFFWNLIFAIHHC